MSRFPEHTLPLTSDTHTHTHQKRWCNFLFSSAHCRSKSVKEQRSFIPATGLGIWLSLSSSINLPSGDQSGPDFMWRYRGAAGGSQPTPNRLAAFSRKQKQLLGSARYSTHRYAKTPTQAVDPVTDLRGNISAHDWPLEVCGLRFVSTKSPPQRANEIKTLVTSNESYF